MDFHHRKLLILQKINSSNDTKPIKDKKNNSCDDGPCLPPCPDDCNYVLPSPPPPPPPPSHNNSSSILILTLCILGFAFVLVSYFSIVRYRSRSSRRNPQPLNETREDFVDENHGPVVDHPIWYIRTVGLNQSVIDSISVFKYQRDGGLIEGTDCSVCLSEFQEDENLRLLPKCQHAFHIHCIDTWLRSHTNCPMCRAPVVHDGNSGQVSVGDTSLNGSGSVGEDEGAESVETRGERAGDVEENRTSDQMRVWSESIGSLPIEEGRSDGKEIAEKSSGLRNKARLKSDLAERSVKLDEEMEPVRRSVSMDASSASMVYQAVANKCQVEGEGSSNMAQVMKPSSGIVVKQGNRSSSIYQLMKSSSLGRSLQMVPVSMKRSFSSSSGKSSLPTHSRSQDSY